jgi:hypothetical protein
MLYKLSLAISRFQGRLSNMAVENSNRRVYATSSSNYQLVNLIQLRKPYLSCGLHSVVHYTHQKRVGSQ